MATPLTFGNRPVLSSTTNPVPDTLHTSAMGLRSRASHALWRSMARMVRSESLGELALRASMRSLMLLPCLGKSLAAYQVEHVSGEVLQDETRRALRGRFQKQPRVDVLMGSHQPISLSQAREIYQQALVGKFQGDEQLLWQAVSRFHEEATAEENQAMLEQLLNLTLPPAMQARLVEFSEASKRNGRVNPDDFADLFQGTDMDDQGHNALQMVVLRMRDIALIDLFIANGARLGERNQEGLTEQDIALQSGDHFLAAKLKLAQNYQTLRDQHGDRNLAAKCAIVAYEFDEEKMSYETAARKLFQHIDTHAEPYTHGALVCRHTDGRVTSRLVHSACPLKDDTMVVSIAGDLSVPRFSKEMKKLAKQSERLVRSPLHPEASNKPSNTLEKPSVVHEAGRRLTWGVLKGGQAALLSQVVEGPVTSAISGVCGALIGLRDTGDDKNLRTAEAAGMLLGGGLGAVAGVPMMGAQVGKFVAHSLPLASQQAVTAIGEECGDHLEEMERIVTTGGVIYVMTAAGEYLALSEATMRSLFGAATGLLMPAVMFHQNWDNRYFRMAALALILLTFTGLGAAAVCTLVGETGALATAATGLGSLLSTVSPPAWVLRGILLTQGVMNACHWEPRRLLAMLVSARGLLLRSVGYKEPERQQLRSYPSAQPELPVQLRTVRPRPEPNRLPRLNNDVVTSRGEYERLLEQLRWESPEPEPSPEPNPTTVAEHNPEPERTQRTSSDAASVVRSHARNSVRDGVRSSTRTETEESMQTASQSARKRPLEDDPDLPFICQKKPCNNATGTEQGADKPRRTRQMNSFLQRRGKRNAKS